MWKLPKRNRSSSKYKSGGFKGVSPLAKKSVLLPNDSGNNTQKTKTLKLNALGRLESFELSRSVFDESSSKNSQYPNKNQILHKEIKPYTKVENGKLRFRKDSEICRDRKRRRDEIMRKTGGKGIRVKNALWNTLSFIQCR